MIGYRICLVCSPSLWFLDQNASLYMERLKCPRQIHWFSPHMFSTVPLNLLCLLWCYQTRGGRPCRPLVDNKARLGSTSTQGSLPVLWYNKERSGWFSVYSKLKSRSKWYLVDIRSKLKIWKYTAAFSVWTCIVLNGSLLVRGLEKNNLR